MSKWQPEQYRVWRELADLRDDLDKIKKRIMKLMEEVQMGHKITRAKSQSPAKSGTGKKEVKDGEL